MSREKKYFDENITCDTSQRNERPSLNYTKGTTDNRCHIRGCRAAKERSRGINHVLREFFPRVNEHDIENGECRVEPLAATFDGA